MNTLRMNVLIIFSLLLASCTQEGADPPRYSLPQSYAQNIRITLTDAQMQQMKFSTAVATRHSIPVEVEAQGEIEVNPTLTTPTHSLVPGNIESVNVQIGDRVHVGQILARLRSDEVAQIESELLKTTLEFRGEKAQLEAEHKYAQATFERKQLLFNEGIVPKSELQGAETALAKSSAALENLEFRRKAAIDSTAQRMKIFGLSHKDVDRLIKTGEVDTTFSIVSPRTGIVTERQVDPGEAIAPADKLFEVSDLSQVWLLAQVFEKDIIAVKKGEPVVVLLDSIPGKTFSGKIDFVGTELDEHSRTLPVRANVDNRLGLLKPKMFARLIVRTAQDHMLAVPQKAVQKVGETYVAYVALAPNTFQERHVELGRTLGEYTEVVSGLKEGERVVADGSLQLQGLAIEQSKK